MAFHVHTPPLFAFVDFFWIYEGYVAPVTLDEVWGSSAACVRDQLWEADTPGQRFRILDRQRAWSIGAARGGPPCGRAVRSLERRSSCQ
jgi:hypothetical protein